MPRSWQLIEEVPRAIRVRGRDGTFRGDPDKWLDPKSFWPRTTVNQLGPFTEVIED